MKIKGIDDKKCTVCMECVKECPPGLFSEERKQSKGKRIVFSDTYGNCIGCGHCISICPHNAICFEPAGESLTFPHIEDISRIIPYQNMLSFLQGKRSIRRFKPTPLPVEEIQAVLAAMQYAPSATNARRWEYVVVTNPETRKFLESEIITIIKKVKVLINLKWLIAWMLPETFRKSLTNPGMKLRLQEVIADHEQGIDNILFHAPCIIILHSPRYAHMSGNDAGIALTYGMLAAQSRGIGTCWDGYAQEAFYLKKKLKKRLGIPAKHSVFGVIIMGYPDVTYHRVPVREQLKVQFIDT
ncbi:MAG: nitroreductase family protein [Spirochaetales bacterium]|nr:nitroreductase family protein [Spirochaetales bacterium]